MPQKSDVSLKIYDSSGKLIRTLVEGERKAGKYSLTWDGKDEDGKTVSSGAYFYQLDRDGEMKTKQAILLK